MTVRKEHALSQYEALGVEGVGVGEARARGREKRARGFDG